MSASTTTTAVAAAAAAQQRRDGRVVCVSLQNDKPVSLQMEALTTEDPARVRGLLNEGEKWARYPVGCLWWLMRELRKQESAVAEGGVTIMLDSDVPVGAGCHRVLRLKWRRCWREHTGWG
ncbi:MAG: hypothetical protein HC898_01515 [Phycisphaerales bacterium]|nr:hypothetical protein [Phycisphaerales bacterium]